jgi:tetratricopeptide (TPR) repeat protein
MYDAAAMSEAKQIPILDMVVEVGIVRMRVGVSEAGMNYLPRSCIWVDQRSGMILHFEMTEPLTDYVGFVLDSLSDLAERIGGVPRQIQLRDVKLAGGLKEVLEPAGIEIVVRESLPNFDNAVNGMMDFRGLGGGKRKPGLLDQKGMTLDHLIAFADAGKLFYQARLWNVLHDEELIAIEPEGPPGARFAQVLGNGGQVFGLGFVPSLEASKAMAQSGEIPRGGLWNILYGTIDEIPFEDGEAWEQHDLPVADEQAYALFLRRTRSREFDYGDSDQVVWAEGLMRALAATKEDEIDRGRWEKLVETLKGPVTYKFFLPVLLEQMARDVPLDPASSPAQQAEALMAAAHGARGRREVQLARRALELDPDSVPALMFLAQLAGDVDRALPLYQRATEAAARKLGPEMFQNAAGHFWLIDETRPYMRARQMCAMSLLNSGQHEQAIPHFRELLSLNPNDNQGIRYTLAQALLAAGKWDELNDLLNKSNFVDDAAPEWLFTRALLEYRYSGDSPEARQRLMEAHQQNPHVIPLLIGRKRMPLSSPPSFTPGSGEEAIEVVTDIRDGWAEAPGAIEWLEEVAPKTHRKPAQNKKPPAKNKGRKRR